jgi:hypothetical protein
MVGAAVFRMVVSSDSIKNATATIQGSSRLAWPSGGSSVAFTPGSPMLEVTAAPVSLGFPRSAVSRPLVRPAFA